jgi:hypothetical protein
MNIIKSENKDYVTNNKILQNQNHPIESERDFKVIEIENLNKYNQELLERNIKFKEDTIIPSSSNTT